MIGAFEDRLANSLKQLTTGAKVSRGSAQGLAHKIDVCNWAQGGYPVLAQGQGGRQIRTGADYGHIFDHFAVEYTYQDGTKLFSQNRHMPGCWNNISHHGYGTDGHAQFGAGTIEGPTNWRMREKPANPYQVEHDVLFDAIRNDKPHNDA